MKIIILGAGQVGSSVAENLVSEANDITVVDTDPHLLQLMQNRLDLRSVVGNAASPSVMRQAGADDADLLIAVTQSDQTNLCACRIARTLFNLPTRIARLRSADYVEYPELLDENNFAVDFSICPEQIVTEYIRKLIEFPTALQVLEFADGLLSLIAVRAVGAVRWSATRSPTCHVTSPTSTPASPPSTVARSPSSRPARPSCSRATRSSASPPRAISAR